MQDKSHFLTAYNLFAEFPNFMLEKNIAKQIRDAMSNQTKCRLKFWGLTSVRNDWNDAGKYDQVSRQNAT